MEKCCYRGPSLQHDGVSVDVEPVAGVGGVRTLSNAASDSSRRSRSELVPVQVLFRSVSGPKRSVYTCDPLPVSALLDGERQTPKLDEEQQTPKLDGKQQTAEQRSEDSTSNPVDLPARPRPALDDTQPLPVITDGPRRVRMLAALAAMVVLPVSAIVLYTTLDKPLKTSSLAPLHPVSPPSGFLPGISSVIPQPPPDPAGPAPDSSREDTAARHAQNAAGPHRNAVSKHSGTSAFGIDEAVRSASSAAGIAGQFTGWSR